MTPTKHFSYTLVKGGAMEKWDEMTGEFDVVASDGRQFHVLVWTTMMKTPAFGDPNPEPIEGPKTAKTSEGYTLNRVDDDNWIIAELELPVKRVRGDGTPRSG